MGQSRNIIDASPKGALMSKTEDEAFSLFNEIAFYNFKLPFNRLKLKKAVGIIDVDILIELQGKTNALLLELPNKLYIGPVGMNMVQSPFIIYDY